MTDSSRIEELKRRVQTDPASIAFAALAEEYRRAGRFEEAIAVCEAGLQRHPAYLSARVTLGRSLLEIEQYDEAREELEGVLRVAPENLAAIRALAEIHRRRGEISDALEQYGSVQGPGAVPDTDSAAVGGPAMLDSPGDRHAESAFHPKPQRLAVAPIRLFVPEGGREMLEGAGFGAEAPVPDAGPPPAAGPRQADPALAPLEAWLAAILRARDSLPR